MVLWLCCEKQLTFMVESQSAVFHTITTTPIFNLNLMCTGRLINLGGEQVRHHLFVGGEVDEQPQRQHPHLRRRRLRQIVQPEIRGMGMVIGSKESWPSTQNTQLLAIHRPGACYSSSLSFSVCTVPLSLSVPLAAWVRPV